MTYSSCSSNYFFNRNPQRFGSQQEDYLNQVNEIVSATADRIHDTVNKKSDLTQLFHDLLDSLGTTRHNIAQQHGTRNAEIYGQRRDRNTVEKSIMTTMLYEAYGEYNQPLMARLQNYLRKMPHTDRAFQQTELKVPGKPCLGRKTSTDIAILSAEKMKEWSAEYSRENYERICDLCAITPLDTSYTLEQLFKHLSTKDVMRVIKEKSIDDYKRLKTTSIFLDIREQFAGKKSDWVLATERCEIRGKMYALTQYITWMYRTYTDDPVELMTTRPDPTVISLIHQDVFLIQETLNDIADLFKQAIEWDGKNTQELTDLVGLINYLFAHSMPFIRGSAAIAEWLEMAIYRYHGLDLQYNEATSINMEALVQPLNEFIEKYPSMIKIEPIPTRGFERK